MTTRIYIAGPITGHPGHKAAFAPIYPTRAQAERDMCRHRQEQTR